MAQKLVKEFKVHPYVQFLIDRYDPYRRHLQAQGIPILDGSFVSDVRTVEVGHWNRRGGKGAILNFSDQNVAEGYVAEIPPGESVKPLRMMYEEIIVVVEGRGATEVWVEGSKHRSFEWQRGSVFAIPLNAMHQHHNASGSEPARYFAVNSAPIAFGLFRDPDYIYNSTYHFRDRFDPSVDDFFSREGEYLTEYYGGVLHTNFIPDIRAIKLVPRAKRGKGVRNMYIHLAGSGMFAHVSEFPSGTYKKAHRHRPGVFIYMLDSTGYTLMWKEGEEPVRYDWHEGSVISPPASVFHQHFSTGAEPCRFVALHATPTIRDEDETPDMIEFSDEEPWIRQLYMEECARNGVEVDLAYFESSPVGAPG